MDLRDKDCIVFWFIAFW